MAKNISGLKRGGPGRKPGVPNKATQDVKTFCQEFMGSEEYRENAKRRVLRGRAPHLETLMMHYAYGKPKETIALEHIPAFVIESSDGDSNG
jgi:hypothetical protein